MALLGGRRRDLEEEAGLWVARMRASGSAEDRRAFAAWYDADPAHARAYDRLSHYWDAAARLDLASPLADGRR